MKNNINIAIIGFGRFGQLLAELLQKDGQVHIVSRSKIKDTKFKQIELEELAQMDWVIPCVPISAFEETLRTIKPFLRQGSLVIDVCSVKTLPCRWMKKHLPKNVSILGTHPMFGPDSARYGLAGLSMVFCPVRIKSSELKGVMQVFKQKKLDTLVMTPEAHDKEAAVSLSLVHFIGRGLGGMKIKPQQVSTMGYDRLLTVNETVENDTLELFFDMHKYNPYAAGVRKRYLKSLTDLDQAIIKKTL